MAVSLLHTFVNPASDLPGFTGTKPSNWNAQHALTGTANSVLGYDGSGNALDGNLFWAAGILAGGTGAASTLTLESTTGAGSGDAIFFKTGSQVERARFDANGSFVLGGTAGITDVIGTDTQLQVHGTGASSSAATIFRWSANTTSPKLGLIKSRGATIGTHAALTSGDNCGTLLFEGDDGTNFQTAANINCTVDGTVAAATMPGRLTFSTSVTNAATEAMRIDSSQRVIIANGGAANFFSNGLELHTTNGGYAGSLMMNWGSGAGKFKAGRSDSNVIGTHTAVASGESLMEIDAFGSDGTTLQNAAQILAVVDGTVSGGIVPGRWVFNTSNTSGASTEAMRIDSGGHVVIGGAAAQASYTGLSFNPQLQVHGTNPSTSIITATRWQATGGGPTLLLAHSRGAVGTQTAVTSGDNLGGLSYQGSDGTQFQEAANVGALVDAAVSAGIVPGRLLFNTNNTSGISTEAMRIDSTQRVILGGTASIADNFSSGAQFQNHGLSASQAQIATFRWAATIGQPAVTLSKSRGATIGTFAAVAAADGLGVVEFEGDDGAAFQPSAQVKAQVDASVSAGIVPGRLILATADTTGTMNEHVRIDLNGAVQVQGPSSSLGYSSIATAGTGGTITQVTNRTTGVTLNKICGAITLVSAAGSASFNTFTVTNSTIAATDTVICNQKSGTDKYEIFITAVAAGSFNITFATTGGTTTEQPVFNFAIIKAVTS